MNIIVILTIIATITSFKTDKFLEKEGITSNYGSKTEEAINSGLGKGKDIILTNDPGYKNPIISLRLPLRRPIEGGEPSNAEDVGQGSEEYYNGALGIKTSVSFCNQFITRPQACVNQGTCGWCMGEGTCINGTKNGPVNNGDCLRGKYVFENPDPNWNPVTIPNAVLNRTNFLGAQLTTIVQQPEVKN